MECERYAVWWVPHADSGLARFGAEWMGWCPDRGVSHARGRLGKFAKAHANLPPALRLGGLHAPFGSAFRLAENRSPWVLERAIADLAGRIQPIPLPRLRLEARDGRVMLATEHPQTPLAQLIDSVAETVRPFRMTSSLAAMAGAGMPAAAKPIAQTNPCQTERAARFAFALTGRSAATREIMAELGLILDPILAEPQILSDLALICDPGGNRPWRVLERFELQGGPETGLRPQPSGMDCFGPLVLTPLLATTDGIA